ncbi:MAG: CPBP family intramembrane glutamic endopeptidase [Sporomusaceae bacterium]|nr:CPBP family intramembrane glutamic endopeptidase [Sporomusaceae bacterium]
MFPWLRFGKRLDAGIQSYSNGLFEQARAHFENALVINPGDFVANFWLLRVHTRLRNQQEIQWYAAKCSELRPDLSEVVDCWLEQSANTLTTEAWAELDMAVDQRIRDYQKNRRYVKKDIVTILLILLGIFVGSVAFVGSLMVFNKSFFYMIKQSFTLRLTYEDILCAPFVVYYCRKPKLIQNVWLQIREARGILKDINFRRWIMFIFFFKIIAGIIVISIVIFTDNAALNAVLQTNVIYLDPLVIISAVVTAPIAEEVFYRGIVFQYLKLFSRRGAYIGSSLLFFVDHGLEANNFQFFMGIFLAYLYERYNTLAAPIIMHSIYNTVLPIFVIIYFRLIPLL